MYPAPGKFVDPKTVVSHFHLREGDHVADFGAGSGHYMKPLSLLVGREGAVYLLEIQKNLVESLGHKAAEEHLTNVHPMWCDLEAEGGVKLQDATLDAGLISNTLFQFENKESALKEVARLMRKGGKLMVIDWTDSFGGMGPRSEDVVTEDAAKILLEAAGFSYERSFPAGGHHYGIVARKV